jgi:hypothetical protein
MIGVCACSKNPLPITVTIPQIGNARPIGSFLGYIRPEGNVTKMKREFMFGKVAPEGSYLYRQQIVLFTLGAVALFWASIALDMSLLHLFCAVSSRLRSSLT